MAEFLGLYRGRVVNVNDPLRANRLILQVPQLFGTTTTPWALPAVPVYALPRAGDKVWVSFEGGDPSRPSWWGGEVAVPGQVAAANATASAAASAAQAAANSYTDTKVQTYTNQHTGFGLAWAASDVSFAVSSSSTSWMDVVWGNQDASWWPNASIYTAGGSATLNAPYSASAIVISATLTTSAWPSAGGWWALRIVDSTGFVHASTPPFDGSSFFAAEATVSAAMRWNNTFSLKIQHKMTNPTAGNVTLYGDNNSINRATRVAITVTKV